MSVHAAESCPGYAREVDPAVGLDALALTPSVYVLLHTDQPYYLLHSIYRVAEKFHWKEGEA